MRAAGMMSAVFAVVLGALSWFGAPRAVPVFALALGANAVLRRHRAQTRSSLVLVMALVGMALGGGATAILLARGL